MQYERNKRTPYACAAVRFAASLSLAFLYSPILGAQPPGGMNAPPPEVAFVNVQTEEVTLTTEGTGAHRRTLWRSPAAGERHHSEALLYRGAM